MVRGGFRLRGGREDWLGGEPVPWHRASQHSGVRRLEWANLTAALVFAAAAALVGGFVARRLRQSTLARYVLAGVVLGVIPGAPDEASVTTLADIGVVLLLFSLGVQFDLRELSMVQRVALPGAAV